jgi:hypothetical protein
MEQMAQIRRNWKKLVEWKQKQTTAPAEEGDK